LEQLGWHVMVGCNAPRGASDFGLRLIDASRAINAKSDPATGENSLMPHPSGNGAAGKLARLTGVGRNDVVVG